MPNLRITSPRPMYATSLATALGVPDVQPGADGPSRLRVGPNVPAGDVLALVGRFAPLRLEVETDASVEGMVIDVGSVARVTTPVRLHVPPAWRRPAMIERLRVELVTGSGAPLTPPEPACTFVSAPGGGARTTAAGQLLAAILGLPEWTGMQDAHGLRLSAGVTGCAAVLPALTLRLRGYDGEAAGHRRLHAALRREGWNIERATPGRHGARKLALRVPSDLPEHTSRTLLEVLAAHLAGVEPTIVEPHADVAVELDLPTVAESSPVATLRRVAIRTDDPAHAEPFAQSLRNLGMAEVLVSVGLSFEGGFRVRHHPQLMGEPAVADLHQVVNDARRSVDPAGEHVVNTYRVEVPALLETVEVDLPLRAAREGALLRNLVAGAGSFHVHVGGCDRPRELIRRIEGALRAGGVGSRVSELGTTRGEPRIAVGSASIEVGRHVARIVEELTGVQLEVRRTFSPTDDDIWVVLPVGTRLRDVAPSAPAPRAVRTERRSFVAVEPAYVRVGARVLTRRAPHALAPRFEAFRHTCIDGPTAALLDHLVTSLRLKEPVLLEGATAAGKTSAILLLAALLGQPVVRLNLSGQTDTGELIGRYAPREGGWAWQDGVIPRAMREGWWVILDELNLAEPAVAERLNPVLEREPSLVLTEGSGVRFGPGGVPVAEGFMVFATMNPSDGVYGGRNALSPALRDRFTAQRSCPLPGEREHRDLLVQSVLGAAPDVLVRGVAWQASRLDDVDAPHAVLADLPGIERALEALARFHASVDTASRAEDESQRLGAQRREGLTVSRRTLLAVLDFLAMRLDDHEVRFGEALEEAVARYYTARAATPEDVAAIDALARAAGVVGGNVAADGKAA